MGQRGKTRRQFLQLIGVGAASLALPACGSRLRRAEGAAPPAKPNILFILTDDHRWDALGCTGHPFLNTPNIDRIREEGALFKNAFVTTALCSPSRASFLTGTYAHTHGVKTNKAGFDRKKTPSFPEILQASGEYCTAFIGKWHMGESSDSAQPGFDYWLSFVGQGKYQNPRLNENGRGANVTGYLTDILSDHAVKWLAENNDKPFCLCLSHKAAHHPFTPAERHAGLYADCRIPEPPSSNDSLENKPKWQQKVLTAKAGQPHQWRAEDKESAMDYLRCIQAVDDGVGRVLETLEETGRLDNTIIIFAGDNGYLWGEHRRKDKAVAYEESIRIPLLMRYPGRIAGGTTVGEMVLNVDIAPTLLEAAGVMVPEWMEGESIWPLLKGRNKDWRKSFLYENWAAPNQLFPRMVAVRTEKWKYVTYPDLKDIAELYDLENDPYEMDNLATKPEYAAHIKIMTQELDEVVKQPSHIKRVAKAVD